MIQQSRIDVFTLHATWKNVQNPSGRSPRPSIFRRLLNAIDHQHFNGSFRRFQSQPELLLKCRKDRSSGSVGRWWRRFRAAGYDRALPQFWSPLQLDVVKALKLGLVDDRPAQLLGQCLYEIREWHSVGLEITSSHSHAAAGHGSASLRRRQWRSPSLGRTKRTLIFR